VSVIQELLYTMKIKVYVYVRLKVQPGVHGFICILYSSLFFALHFNALEHVLAGTPTVFQPVHAPMD
jgi:hypothetical protein